MAGSSPMSHISASSFLFGAIVTAVGVVLAVAGCLLSMRRQRLITRDMAERRARGEFGVPKAEAERPDLTEAWIAEKGWAEGKPLVVSFIVDDVAPQEQPQDVVVPEPATRTLAWSRVPSVWHDGVISLFRRTPRRPADVEMAVAGKDKGREDESEEQAEAMEVVVFIAMPSQSTERAVLECRRGGGSDSEGSANDADTVEIDERALDDKLGGDVVLGMARVPWSGPVPRDLSCTVGSDN